MIVNAKGAIVGRLASYVAKQALNGELVIVVNAEKAIVSGDKKMILAEEKEKLKIRNIGNPMMGPFHQKRADKYLRKCIRGMLPFKKPRGRQAYKNIMVYMGVPKDEIKKSFNIELKDSDIIELAEIKKDVRKYMLLGDVCESIGGRW